MDYFTDAKQLKIKLHDILTGWPLYREYRYSGVEDAKTLPPIISHNCSFCRKDQFWDGQYPGYARKSGFAEETYTCRNCKGTTIRYYFYWGAEAGKTSALFIKIGQYPAQMAEPPAELGKQLDSDDLDLYKKALTCRNFSFGLGALGYLRRVVENRMNDLLELIAQAASEAGFAQDLLRELEAAKKSNRFDDKVTYAAKILPPHLKPGGQNPIDLLHDLASEGLHARSEDDCLEIFDKSKVVFEYVFRQLKVNQAEKKAFADSVKQLAEKKAARI
jgi:hypothetical protein